MLGKSRNLVCGHDVSPRGAEAGVSSYHDLLLDDYVTHICPPVKRAGAHDLQMPLCISPCILVLWEGPGVRLSHFRSGERSS